MTRTQYDVVIIDSGISDLSEEGVRLSFDNNGILCVENDLSDELGHGTAVYNIIKKHNPNTKCYIIL